MDIHISSYLLITILDMIICIWWNTSHNHLKCLKNSEGKLKNKLEKILR
jgi:hypothetical protein